MEKQQAIGLVALTRCVASKDEKTAIALIDEGVNLGFELTAKISGRLTRGTATSSPATSSLLSKQVVAELLRRCGVTREAAQKHLLAIADDALKAGRKVGEDLVDENPEILVMIHEIEKHVIDHMPPQTRAGVIKVISSPVEWQRIRIDGEDFKGLLAA